MTNQLLCSSCGEPLSEGAKFCKKCGASQETAQPSMAFVPPPSPEQTQAFTPPPASSPMYEQPAPPPPAFGQPAQPQSFGQSAQPQPFGQPAQPQPFGQPAQPQPFGQAEQPQPFGQHDGTAAVSSDGSKKTIAIVAGIVGILAIAAVLFFVVFKDGGKGKSAKDFIGYWELISSTEPEMKDGLKEFKEFGWVMLIHIKNEETMVMYVVDEDFDRNSTLDLDDVIYDLEMDLAEELGDGDVDDEAEYKLSGDTLTITINKDNMKLKKLPDKFKIK